jgi:hypothetical protein
MRRPIMIAAAVTTAGFVLVGLLSFGLFAAARAGDTLTKKQFLEAANATCEDAYRAIDAALEEQFADVGENAAPSAAQIEAGVASVVEILRDAAAEVNALVGPPALERKVKRFLSRFRAVVGEFEADPQGAFAEELSGYPFAKPDRLARKIGLDACVQRND